MADGWAASAAILLSGAGVGMAAIVKSWLEARKPEAEKPAPTLVGGAIMGSSDVSRVGDWLASVRNAIDRSRDQAHEDSRDLRREIERNTAALERNAEALADGAVTPRELAAMLARLEKLKGTGE